jgi:spore maturation protein CgeB
MVTAPEEMRQYDLSGYDAVLAFGDVLRRLYRERGLCDHVFTWHEAADTRVFRPREAAREADLVWVGNWGDGERSAELAEYLLEPCRQLGLAARVHGVRYPEAALAALRSASIAYGGFVANYRVPELFSRHTMTVHVPRRPYVRALRGVPTIRMFEALACGIPLVSAPWDDTEQLFRPGEDFLVAADGAAMCRQLRALREEPELRENLRQHGLQTIRSRHTCAHRVDELLSILQQLGLSKARSHSSVRSGPIDATEAS